MIKDSGQHTELVLKAVLCRYTSTVEIFLSIISSIQKFDSSEIVFSKMYIA